MSTLYIREYATLAAGVHDTSGPRFGAAMPQEPGVKDQAVPFTGASALSNAFDPTTRYIAIIGDTAFCYTIGPAPIVVAGVNLLVPASALLFLGVQGNHKIAVVAAP